MAIATGIYTAVSTIVTEAKPFNRMLCCFKSFGKDLLCCVSSKKINLNKQLQTLNEALQESMRDLIANDPIDRSKLKQLGVSKSPQLIKAGNQPAGAGAKSASGNPQAGAGAKSNVA
eukprot:1113541_1